jgi:hypothetical protein
VAGQDFRCLPSPETEGAYDYDPVVERNFSHSSDQLV